MNNHPQHSTTRWFLFYKDQLLLQPRNSDSQTGRIAFQIPQGADIPKLEASQPVLEVIAQDGTPLQAVSVPKTTSCPPGWQWVGLRASFDLLSLEEYLQAGKAYQMLYWDQHSKFCPVCGTVTEQHALNMKQCPTCGYEIYPPISTAIIVLIKRGEDEVLLVHARNFKGNFKGLVAGFLEAGETLEQCVEREVMEETGLCIHNIRYVASQPWPYPSGLMVGFVAEYLSGEIKMQEEELSTADFYHRDHLPELPRKLSIARKLIDAWLEHRI